MDNNQNPQNPPANPSQPAQGPTPQPQTDTPSQIQPTFNPPAAPPATASDQPTQPLSTPPSIKLPPQDIASFAQPQTPAVDLNIPSPSATDLPSPTAPQLTPQPTWQMPSDQPSKQGTTTPPSGNLSTLDNPWGAPAQPPPIDAGPPSTFPPQSQPTLTPPQPSFENPPTPTAPTDLSTLASTPAPGEPTVSESAPTDLSHLIGNNPLPENNTPQQPTAETLVAPPANAGPDVPTSPQEERKGIPKWVIGVGIGLFVLVAGASAYFILGIGRAPETESIPATQAPKTTQQVKPPAPLPSPVSQPAATGSASFDQLQGGSSGGQQATSAADLLRQRQKQGQ